MWRYLPFFLLMTVSACGGVDAPTVTPIDAGGPILDANATDANGGAVPRTVPFSDYLDWASAKCRPPSQDSRSTVLLGWRGEPSHVNNSTFFFEIGFGYLFVNQACEMFLHPRENEEMPYLYWPPPRYKSLSTQEFAEILYELRALEWERLDSTHYGLYIVESRVLLKLEDSSYSVSGLYHEISDAQTPLKEWNDTDYFIESVLSSGPAGNYEKYYSETSAFTGEFVQMYVVEADTDVKWEQDDNFVHEWPLSFPPSDLDVEKIPAEYCTGDSIRIGGEDAEKLRSLRTAMLSYGDVYPNGTNALPVQHEGQKLWMFIRETLPIEQDEGGVSFAARFDSNICGQ